MAIAVGSKLPDASLYRMTESGPQAVSVADLTEGKKVVIFALPGAFTPTCSAKHLPGFVDHASAIKAKGVDAIICISVNDAFVMGAWGKDQNVADTVDMIADGNGEFTRAIGLEMDGSGFGMGQRSQRYAMIVEDRIVKHLFVEEPREFSVSSAESVLEHL